MRRLILTTLATALLATPAFASTIHVGVNGLVCAFCVSGIEAAFEDVPGVTKTSVDLDKKLVTLTTEGAGPTDAAITEKITDTGYTVTSIHRVE